MSAKQECSRCWAPWHAAGTSCEPDAGDVEVLAEALCEAAHPALRRESCIADRAAVSCPDCRTQADTLASDWLANLRAEVARAAAKEALREAARDALSSPSTQAGDEHSGEVWAAWLSGRAEQIGSAS